MVFQDPMTSLNPVLTIGVQVSEPLMLHLGMNKREAEERTVELLSLVGISEAEKRLGQYPHHFSGGMRQRVMIAMALSCNPKLLIADEPTTALDVTIQAQILQVLRDLTSRLGTSVILITHNFGLVAGSVDRVMVMYAGLVMEQAPTLELFNNPRHPYTQGLFRCAMHINYFGDELLFTGYALATGSAWALLVPLVMAAGFAFFNIPQLDKHLSEHYGSDFQVYARHTKKFVPFLY